MSIHGGAGGPGDATLYIKRSGMTFSTPRVAAQHFRRLNPTAQASFSVLIGEWSSYTKYII